MNTKTKDAPHDVDADDLDYLPIHPFALLATVLAAISLLGIGAPVLILVSVVAIFLAVIAIRNVGDPPKYSGLKLAKFALFLGMLAASMSLTFKYGREWYIRRTAQQHAAVLIDLVMQGRYSEVWPYGSDPDARPPAGTDMEAYYKLTERKKGSMLPPAVQLKVFTSVAPISVIANDRQQGEMRYVGYYAYPRDDAFYEQVGCDYQYTPAESGDPPMRFRILMLRRDFKGKGGVQWRFRRWEPIDTRIEPGMVELPVIPSADETPQELGPAADGG